jgi:hypothetical protein
MLAPAVAVLGFGEPSDYDADAEDWYMTVEGVLADDCYSLYPFEKKNLIIGFSKFGEMINTLPDQNVGLQYGDRDAFAPPAGVAVDTTYLPKEDWYTGWLINITYVYQPTGQRRNVWAMAHHSDGAYNQWANGWIRVDDSYTPDIPNEAAEKPTNAGYFIDPTEFPPQNVMPGLGLFHGGRKTNGSAYTYPIQVLYDGPRRFIARLHTTIFDWDIELTQALEPLVNITFTIDFNKVKKEVNILKDIKYLPSKTLLGPLPIEIIECWDREKDTPSGAEWYDELPVDGWSSGIGHGDFNTKVLSVRGMVVQFSNRGEWDLGPKPPADMPFASFAHFFTEGFRWKGKDPWMYLQTDGDTNNDLSPYQGLGVDDTMQEGLGTVYDRDYQMMPTLPPYRLFGGTWPDALFGYQAPEGFATFDMAQMISSDGLYVGSAAVWPSLSDWTVRGLELGQWWRSMTWRDFHAIEGLDEPWMSPYLIMEHDFLLYDGHYDSFEQHGPDGLFQTFFGEVPVIGDRQFRQAVSYGVTDLQKGVDGEIGNEIDWFWWPWAIPVGDGLDADMPPAMIAMEEPTFEVADDAYMGENIIDREVAYWLKQKFLPWDLNKAVRKPTERFVDFWKADGVLAHFHLANPPVWIPGQDPYRNFDYHGMETDNNNWWGYPNFDSEWMWYEGYRRGFPNSPYFLASGFPERILNLNTSELLERNVDYVIDANGLVEFDSVPAKDTLFKFLYSRIGSTSNYLTDHSSNILDEFERIDLPPIGDPMPTDSLPPGGGIDPPGTADGELTAEDDMYLYIEGDATEDGGDYLGFAPVKMAVVEVMFMVNETWITSSFPGPVPPDPSATTESSISGPYGITFILHDDKPYDEINIQDIIFIETGWRPEDPIIISAELIPEDGIVFVRSEISEWDYLQLTRWDNAGVDEEGPLYGSIVEVEAHKIIKGFHWLQTKHDIFDEEVIIPYGMIDQTAEASNYDMDNAIYFDLSHWPLTTAQVHIQILDANWIMWPLDMDPFLQLPSMMLSPIFVGAAGKVLLNKYQNCGDTMLASPFFELMFGDGGAEAAQPPMMEPTVVFADVCIDFGSGEGEIIFRAPEVNPTAEAALDEMEYMNLRVEVKVVYTPILGSYEWVAVGRNPIPGVDTRGASNVDSVAAAMITEAFDSLKNVPVKLPSLDIQDIWHLSTISLLSKFGVGDAWEDYHMDPDNDDYRVCFKDDWSSTMPIASSNIITVGGPVALANVVSEYFNEFLPVIWRGMPWFQPAEFPWGEMQDLLPLTGWDTNGSPMQAPDGSPVSRQGTDEMVSMYSIDNILLNDRDIGYAVIGTYYDLNGTVGFVVYGLTGDDSFWAGTAIWSTLIDVYYLHDCGELEELDEPLIVRMQRENPGITAYVLKIDYSKTGKYSDDIHPDVTIVEKLGTISEKPQHDP